MSPPREFYVTDTHPFVWYLADDARLGFNARMAFDSADSGEATIIIPAVALAEAVYLAERGRIETKAELMFGIVENALNYRVYPLDLAIVKKSWELKKLSEIHDKSIVATAKSILASNSSPRMERSETAATFEPYGRFAKDAKFPDIFPREVEILL